MKISKKRLRKIEKKRGVKVQGSVAVLYGVNEENHDQLIDEYKARHPYVKSIICYPPTDPNEPE